MDYTHLINCFNTSNNSNIITHERKIFIERAKNRIVYTTSSDGSKKITWMAQPSVNFRELMVMKWKTKPNFYYFICSSLFFCFGLVLPLKSKVVL